MGENHKKESEVQRLADTVPPPAGENNPYDAPTKVGAVPPATIAAMLQDTGVKEEPSAPRKGATPRPPIAEELVAEEPPVATELPRIADDEESEDHVATVVSPLANAPASSSPPIIDSSATPARDLPVAPATVPPAPLTSRSDFWIIALIVIVAVAAVWWIRR